MNDRSSYPWEGIDTLSLMRPEDVLVYYIYKYKMDKKNKKETHLKSHAGNIYEYARTLGKDIGSNVSKTNK